MDLDTLTDQDRRNLVHLVCVAAWSDADLAQAEREVVLDLAMQMALDEDTIEEVKAWLQHPPPDYDPYDLPHGHHEDFLEALWKVVLADGRIDPNESETLRMIREFFSAMEVTEADLDDA